MIHSGNMMRTRQTDKDLKAAAGHVRYELMMLRASTRYLNSIKPCYAADRTLYNMAVESFLLHYRNLRAFVCPAIQSTRADDVIASDFTGAPNPEAFGDRRSLERDKERINKLLTHISYARAAYESSGDKKWPHQEMEARIDRAMEEFLARLGAERRGWFEAERVNVAQDKC